MQITPGRLTENLIQADSREILVRGKLNLEEVGYLYYCAQAGYGATDPAAIQVIGNARPEQVARCFKRHASTHLQRRWESPAVSQRVEQVLAALG